MHLRLVGEPIALSRIAGDAGADDVFPGRLTSPVSGKDMIEIEIAPILGLSAILTGVLIALEYVVTGEFHFFLRKTFEEQEDDDSRDSDIDRNRFDHFGFRTETGEVLPTMEIMGEEITFFIL